MRQALAGEAGRLALRLRPAGRLAATPARRRLARALLQEAAELGGGAVYDTTAGEMLLLGTMAGAGRRAAAALTALSADAAPPEPFLLPRDAAALLGWAATARVAPPEAAPPPPSLGLEALDARLEALPVDQVLLHRAVARPGSGVPGRGRRLRLSRPALAAVLGPWPRMPSSWPMPRTGWRRGCCRRWPPGRGTCRAGGCCPCRGAAWLCYRGAAWPCYRGAAWPRRRGAA
ncbi:hypothetical protein ACFQY5_15175 [Paeniroseomonas aquatica]|uniref:hypothetical protein n=1 Tax=Paeniroseomonas aquatica TaxID=373043 RepID=UPI0036108768